MAWHGIVCVIHMGELVVTTPRPALGAHESDFKDYNSTFLCISVVNPVCTDCTCLSAVGGCIVQVEKLINIRQNSG